MDAAHEPLSVLEVLKASMGSSAFQAQYLQDPVPTDGNLIKAGWLKEYGAEDKASGQQLIQTLRAGDDRKVEISRAETRDIEIVAAFEEDGC